MAALGASIVAGACVEQKREERGWRATGSGGSLRSGASFGAKPVPRGTWVEPGAQWEVDAAPDLGRAGVLPENMRAGTSR